MFPPSLSNVAVIASSHFGTTGLATAVGEQPIKGLLCNKAQARMTAGTYRIQPVILTVNFKFKFAAVILVPYHIIVTHLF